MDCWCWMKAARWGIKMMVGKRRRKKNSVNWHTDFFFVFYVIGICNNINSFFLSEFPLKNKKKILKKKWKRKTKIVKNKLENKWK